MKNERIYLLPREGNLYKANLHCHSTVRNGIERLDLDVSNICADSDYLPVQIVDIDGSFMGESRVHRVKDVREFFDI